MVSRKNFKSTTSIELDNDCQVVIDLSIYDADKVKTNLILEEIQQAEKRIKEILLAG